MSSLPFNSSHVVGDFSASTDVRLTDSGRSSRRAETVAGFIRPRRDANRNLRSRSARRGFLRFALEMRFEGRG